MSINHSQRYVGSPLFHGMNAEISKLLKKNRSLAVAKIIRRSAVGMVYGGYHLALAH